MSKIVDTDCICAKRYNQSKIETHSLGSSYSSNSFDQYLSSPVFLTKLLPTYGMDSSDVPRGTSEKLVDIHDVNECMFHVEHPSLFRRYS